MKAFVHIALVLGAATHVVAAESLRFPANAVLAAQSTSDGGTARFATGGFRDGQVEFATVNGARQMQVWRIHEPSRSTAQIAALMREQITDLGYEILLDCIDETCGGYDFRYALDLMDEPAMHVDLGDFRFISAMRPGTEDYLSLMISRSASGIFIEYDLRVPEQSTEDAVALSPASGVPDQPADLDQAADSTADLMRNGWLVLGDLNFATSSSQLPDGQYPSLDRLADYLRAHPGARIALVGHTDAEGALAANIALSKRRATSVLNRLATRHDVPRAQMVAEGVGYLAPRWPNSTVEQRRQNRRVEAVLTSAP